MFAPAYMGRGWAFSNAFCSLHEDVGLGNRPFASIAEALEGLRPVFFGPCTPVRTWGTRPIPVRVSSNLGYVSKVWEDAC
jgi:hypothetical protein